MDGSGSEEGMGLGQSRRMGRPQLDRERGLFQVTSSHKRPANAKARCCHHSLNKSNIEQLPPARPCGTGAGHGDMELNKKTSSPGLMPGA